MRSLARAAVVLLLLAAMAGCSQSPAPKAVKEPLPTGAFTTNWTDDLYAFRLAFDAAAPGGLTVRLTDRDSGATTTKAGGDLSEATPGTVLVPALPLAEGHSYLLEALSGGQVVASRAFRASGEDFERPAGAVGQATYDVSTDSVDTHPDEPASFHMAGTGRVRPSGPTTTFLVDGTGTMSMSSEGFAMTMTVTGFSAEYNGDDTVREHYEGTGTMRMSGDGFEGSGTIDKASNDYLGTEDRWDDAGHLHHCTKSRMAMTAHGTMSGDGQEVPFTMETVETSWDDADTGESIWSTTTGTMTLSGPDGDVEIPMDDEGPADDDGKVALADDIDWTGLTPMPAVPGDRVSQPGQHGVRIEYVAEDGGQQTVAGIAFTVVRIVGTPSGGVGGTETVLLAKDGPYAGLVLSSVSEMRRGTETESATIRLTGLA